MGQCRVLVVVASLLCCSLSETFCLAKITPAERNEIVNLHNNLRASVTPSASNMEKMVSAIIRINVSHTDVYRGYIIPHGFKHRSTLSHADVYSRI